MSLQLEALGQRLEEAGAGQGTAGNGDFFGLGSGASSRRSSSISQQIGGSGAAATPSTPGTTSIKDELRQQLRHGRFNEAFQQALGASDLDLVTWLCAEAPRDDIFDVDPPLLSQTILLCLMQQLSFNLGKQTALKLDWLKQISLVFNPQEPEIATFVTQVLGQLQQNLETAAAEVVALGSQERVKDFKFVQRAVKRMTGG